jgi:hypothetical protein
MKKDIIIKYASISDLKYVPDIESAIKNASLQKGTGIAIRSAEYLSNKILENKAVIAFSADGEWAGFCYIESWGHKRFVANSGLIISDNFRGQGLARSIKLKAFELSQEIFPGAKLFGLTTSLAVMKINSSLGYKPVTFSELTDDEEFWKGCQTCPYYDILQRTNRQHCLCTAMLLDPVEKQKEELKNGSQVALQVNSR